MKLKLVRKWKKEGYTIGQLYVDGVFFYNTIEDKELKILAGLISARIPQDTATLKDGE